MERESGGIYIADDGSWKRVRKCERAERRFEWWAFCSFIGTDVITGFFIFK